MSFTCPVCREVCSDPNPIVGLLRSNPDSRGNYQALIVYCCADVNRCSSKRLTRYGRAADYSGLPVDEYWRPLAEAKRLLEKHRLPQETPGIKPDLTLRLA